MPTSFNLETFANAGVTVPIHVVPGGVDATVFRPGLRPLRVPGLRGTVFLSIFEWAFRKGWDVLLSAWAEAFGPDDDVSLVLRASQVTGTIGAAAPIDQRVDAHLEFLGKATDRRSADRRARPPAQHGRPAQALRRGRRLRQRLEGRGLGPTHDGGHGVPHPGRGHTLEREPRVHGRREQCPARHRRAPHGRRPGRVRLLPRPPLGRALEGALGRGVPAPGRRSGASQTDRSPGPQRCRAPLAVEAGDAVGRRAGRRARCSGRTRRRHIPRRGQGNLHPGVPPAWRRPKSPGRATSTPTTAWPAPTAPWPAASPLPG